MADLVLEREFDAPPTEVWDAWTDPDRLAQWWGKRGWTAQRETLVMDVRPGGEFRVDSTSTTGETMTNRARYAEVDPPRRLSWGDERGLAEITLTALSGGRTRMRFTSTVPVSERAAGGLASALDRLHDHLTTKGIP